jgi:hypothetical protein
MQEIELENIFSGGCLCGAIRYRASGKPLNVRVCHCRLCQKAVGAAFNARLLFEETAVDVEGPLATVHSSPDLLRGFCRSCGTSILTKRLSTGWIGLSAGSLDDPGLFKPEAHTWVSAKQPWVVIADGLPQYDEMPPK